MTMTRFVLATLMLGGTLAASAAGQNLLKNGDFANHVAEGLPESWAGSTGQKVSVDTAGAPGGAAQAMRVDLIKTIGDSLGEIRQTVHAKPGTKYLLEGQLRSTKAKLAVLAIKTRKSGKEAQRYSSGWSGTQWTPVTCAFDSGDADEIQVLCRWRQSAKDKIEGQTVWFGALKLSEAGPGDAAAPVAVAAVPAAAPAAKAEGEIADTAVDPGPARLAPTSPQTGPWAEIIRQAASVPAVTAVALPLSAAAGDLFLTPAGAGTRDGHDWANALPGNAPGALQAAWDALQPGHTCHLGSGIYVKQALNVSSGGSGASAMKRLAGEDTGSGLPWLVGDWSPDDLSHGAAFLSLGRGVSNCTFEHLRLARYQDVAQSREGHHAGLRFADLQGYELRYGFFLCGGGLADKPDEASHDIEIADCVFTHFTKSAVRLQGGNYDVRILNVTADAGGKAWMKESFQVGFNVQGDAPRRHFSKDDKAWAEEHDIIFVNCVSRNCIWSEDHYWQGDGYCSERGITNLAFINCSSFDNADGGWDLKSDNVIFVNCIGARSKMNWRLWGTAYLYNCLSANAFKRGGGWTSDGLWAIGNIHAGHMTIANNASLQVFPDSKGDKTAAIVLEHSIVAGCVANGDATPLCSAPARVTKVATAEWCPASAKGPAVGEDPGFIQAAAGSTWLGEPANAFDSQRYGRDKGYASAVAQAWRARPAAQLVETARALLRHKGWDDLKQQIESAAKTGAQ